MIGLKKSSDFEERGTMGFHKYGHGYKSIAAMRYFGTLSVESLLSGSRAKSRGSHVDEYDRRAVYEDTILRKPKDGYFLQGQGYKINRKHAQRLMRAMGIAGIC